MFMIFCCCLLVTNLAFWIRECPHKMLLSINYYKICIFMQVLFAGYIIPRTSNMHWKHRQVSWLVFDQMLCSFPSTAQWRTEKTPHFPLPNNPFILFAYVDFNTKIIPSVLNWVFHFLFSCIPQWECWFC